VILQSSLESHLYLSFIANSRVIENILFPVVKAKTAIGIFFLS
jgi:hypothetical protein